MEGARRCACWLLDARSDRWHEGLSKQPSLRGVPGPCGCPWRDARCVGPPHACGIHGLVTHRRTAGCAHRRDTRWRFMAARSCHVGTDAPRHAWPDARCAAAAQQRRAGRAHGSCRCGRRVARPPLGDDRGGFPAQVCARCPGRRRLHRSGSWQRAPRGAWLGSRCRCADCDRGWRGRKRRRWARTRLHAW